MELTAWGQAVRKLRIDRNQTLKEMADAMKVTPAFLSAVETGRKGVPEDLVVKVIRYFRLTGEDAAQLRRLAVRNVQRVQIDTRKATGEQRELAAAFARRLAHLSEADEKQLRRILQVKED